MGLQTNGICGIASSIWFTGLHKCMYTQKHTFQWHVQSNVARTSTTRARELLTFIETKRQKSKGTTQKETTEQLGDETNYHQRYSINTMVLSKIATRTSSVSTFPFWHSIALSCWCGMSTLKSHFPCWYHNCLLFGKHFHIEVFHGTQWATTNKMYTVYLLAERDCMGLQYSCREVLWHWSSTEWFVSQASEESLNEKNEMQSWDLISTLFISMLVSMASIFLL